ncbi:hypothetical protein AB0I16_34660 [Streptomyces sp. NPDC050703]|uniref:hypothetical protein n=1 Tax=Streptomyces sp. NPDC050703 TaxID=3157218 RepID=UPI00344134D0
MQRTLWLADAALWRVCGPPGSQDPRTRIRPKAGRGARLVDPGEPPAPRPPGQDAGEWEIPRIPLQHERAVLAGAVVRKKLRTTTVRGRAYDIVTHQQAAMPEQLLAPESADPSTTSRSRSPAAARRWT